MFQHLLLCTHGTVGAQKAESLVFEKLLPASPNTRVTILTIVNEDWKWMLGDDWLNTSKSRHDFMTHVDNQLAGEISEDWERLKQKYPAAGDCRFLKIMGRVEEIMARAAEKYHCDMIVIGPFQKKQGKGFRARLAPKKLHPLLSVPLMIAP